MSNLTTDRYHPSMTISGRRPSSIRAGRQRGSAILELAIAVPLLALILAGTMEFGRAFYAAAEVANAARAGVQFAAVNPANASNYTGMQQAATNDAVNVSGLTATASKFCECSDGTSVDLYHRRLQCEANVREGCHLHAISNGRRLSRHSKPGYNCLPSNAACAVGA
jgi:hypothetical protein